METNVVIGLFVGIVVAVFISTATIFFMFRRRYRNLAKQIDEQEIISYQVEHLAETRSEVYDTIGFVPPAKVATYIYRGNIERETREALLTEGSASIVGLHGLGGVGKTELAKHIAEELRDNFEGILWVDVGSKTPQQVVADMLIKCGIQLQPEVQYQQQRAELYNFLRNHRFLVVLDDVRVEAVNGLEDFLPPKPSSVLITSQIQQIGGVFKSYILDHMTLEQSLELMEAILGKEIIDAEKDKVVLLIERCGYIPLAIEIASRRIRQIEGIERPIAHYLEKTEQRFSELRMSGDPRWNMTAVFDISYQELNASDQKRFRMLAAFAPTGFAPDATVAVWNESKENASSALSRFNNLSLVKVVEGSVERYRLHDLLYEYATSKFIEHSEQDTAMNALAVWLLNIFDSNYLPDEENLPKTLPERDNLLRAINWAYNQKNGELLALLTTRTRNWFYVSFTEEWHDWIAWLEASLLFGIEDRQLKANVRKTVGDVQQFRDERDAALASYNEALKLFKEIGAKLGEANVLQAIGDVQQSREELDVALDSYHEALKIFRQVGAKLGEANIHLSLGNIKRQQNDIGGAKDDYQYALNIYQTIGDSYSQARALYSLGDCAIDNDDKTNALAYYQQAKDIWQKIGVDDLVEHVLKPRIDILLAERMNKVIDSTST